MSTYCHNVDWNCGVRVRLSFAVASRLYSCRICPQNSCYQNRSPGNRLTASHHISAMSQQRCCSTKTRVLWTSLNFSFVFHTCCISAVLRRIIPSLPNQHVVASCYCLGFEEHSVFVEKILKTVKRGSTWRLGLKCGKINWDADFTLALG